MSTAADVCFLHARLCYAALLITRALSWDILPGVTVYDVQTLHIAAP